MNSGTLIVRWKLHWPLFFVVMALTGCQSLDKLIPEKITDQNGWYGYATWSPDGTSIIYKADLGEQLEILDLASGDLEFLPIPTNSSDGIIGIDWIDETKIIYLVVTKDKDEVHRRLEIYDLATNEVQEHSLFKGNAYSFCWNRATNTPVIVGTQKPHNESAPIYGDTVFEYDSENEDWSIIYQADPPNFADGIEGIACHPYEDQIAFVELTDTPDTPGNDSSLYIISKDYPTPLMIFEETGKEKFDRPAWSSDGKWIAVHMYSDWKGRRDGITIVPTNNSEAGEVKTVWLLTDFVGDISWSPTEDVLLLRSGSPLVGMNLYRFDLSPWLEGTK